MFVTLLDQSAPTVAPVAIPSNFDFRVAVNNLLLVELLSDNLSTCMSAEDAISASTIFVPTALYAELMSGMSPATNLPKTFARLILLSGFPEVTEPSSYIKKSAVLSMPFSSVKPPLASLMLIFKVEPVLVNPFSIVRLGSLPLRADVNPLILL